MSLNRKITMKIVRGEEIRMLHQVPNTWTEFQAALIQMYGNSEFQVTYIDEESDYITVASNLDYQEALSFHSEKPSIKLFYKAKSLAEDFEELKIEENPEKKEVKAECEDTYFRGCRGRGWRARGRWARWGKSPNADEEPNQQWRCRGGPEFFKNLMHGSGPMGKGIKKFFKKMNKNKFGKHSKLYKLKVLQKGFPRRWIVSAGTTVVISWSVMNKGTMPWPEGSIIQNFGGNFGDLEPVVIGEVKPGEITNISVSVNVPTQQGKLKGMWGVMVNGECIGMLKAKMLAAAESIDAKTVTLENMGFSKEQALRALEACNGDLDLAISSILQY